MLSCDRPDGSTVPVAFVQVGAMLVGSIVRTQEEGKKIKRADELGYFGASRVTFSIARVGNR